ncbi:MAG TPA: hypothetical protein VMV92_35605 [Streptosporangiaceae bacterium]|nr:hypothetical protein [Streptosporangiaceae bacterium]
MTISGPGTVDDLVADAAGAGHQITVRLIRDWTQAGLLDRPRKRPAGRGRGSSQALYPENQRKLLLILLSKRPGNGISSLARIPVGIWMYWGDDYVPVRQARRAMLTWIGDPGVSLRQSKETARAILGQLDSPRATPAARRALLKILTDVGHTGQLDADRLEAAVFDVFEPGNLKIRRAVGHPAAPLMVESVIEVMKARLTAVTYLRDDHVSDDAFYQARHAHLMAYAEYAVKQPAFAGTAPPRSPDMYEPVTAEKALNDCCAHLLTTIGLEIMYPERAAQLRATAGPAGVRAVPQAARQAILKVP